MQNNINKPSGFKRIFCVISWIPAIIVAGIIIYLTLQTGDTSKETSRGVVMSLSKFSIFGINIDISRGADALDSFDSVIRTIAHISEYMFLSLCIGFAVTVNGVRKQLRFFYMFMISAFMACFDEFLQIFVPGRYCDLKDLLCDGLGILVVSGLVFLIGKRNKNKHSEEKKCERRTLLNVCVDNVTFSEAADRVCSMAKKHERRYIVTPNADHVIKMQKDELFRKILNDADLILTDGTPLMWIADSLGNPIKEKIPGADLFPVVCEKSAKEKLSIFILGAGKNVADKAAKNLKSKYHGLKIVGTYTPSMDFGKDEDEVNDVIRCINEKKPDILVVSLGAPKQEKFIYNYRDKMDFGIALPIGAAVDFEAGQVKRAPMWMRKTGLEWFYRFVQEPGRLFKRYFIDDMRIFYLAWKYRYQGRDFKK